MKIGIEKLRCGEYYGTRGKLVIDCSEIKQAFNEKRFNEIPFHDFIQSAKDDLRSGIINKEEFDERATKYHIERIAHLMNGKKWEEPILIIKDFPPIDEYIDGGHRVWAAKCAGVIEIEAISVDINKQDWDTRKSEIVDKVRQNQGNWLKVFDDMGIKYSFDDMLAYHECSHAVLALLFSPYLELDRITLSKSEVSKGNSLSGTDAGTSIKAKRIDRPANDARAITYLAGFIGQNIYLNGKEKILAEKKSIQRKPNSFNIKLCKGDLDLFYGDASTNAKAHGLETIDSYQQFCLGFLVDFLCDERIWSFVKMLVDELRSQSDLTLNKDQLDTIFKKIGLDEYLNEKRQGLLHILEAPSFENDQNTSGSMDGSESIVWTGDLNGDCTARWNGLILRAELMLDDIWWWAVSKDNDDPLDEIDSGNNYDTICTGGKQARQLAEQSAMKFINATSEQ